MNAPLAIKARPAGYIAVIMIAVSTFTALTIDGHPYMNSGWLCTAIGCLMTLPLAVAADRYSFALKPGRDPAIAMRLASVPAALYMAYESAVISRLLVNTVSYSNVQMIPVPLLSLIMYSACAYITLKNGAGIGNASKIWLMCIGVLFITVLIACRGDMRFGWMAPLIGPGAAKIAAGSTVAAGHMTAGLLIVTQAGDRKGHICTRALLAGSAAACILCIYWSVMMPAQLSNHMNRLTGIEQLLSNGRTSLAVLLPISMIWLMVQTASMCGYSFSSALFIQTAVGRPNKYIAASSAAILSFLFANLGLAESDSARAVSSYTYAGILLAVLVVCILDAGRRCLKK